MKPKIHRKELMDKDSIWNAVITVASEYDLSDKDTVLKEAFLVFQYYSEMESGGHEILLNWAGTYIEEVGIENYVNELSAVLEKIGAHDYALMEKKYGQELWSLYMALENGEDQEEAFFRVIQEADNEYHRLNRKLDTLLEAYFVDIHTDVIEVIEN